MVAQVDTIYYQPDTTIPATLNKRPGKDAGYDLYVSETVWVWPFQTVVVPTNLHIHTPAGHFGLVSSRSGNAARGWLTHMGVVDHGFSGQISATVTNLTFFPRRFKKGERIAQLVFIPFAELKDMKRILSLTQFQGMVAQYSNSNRGEQSHNSSGK